MTTGVWQERTNRAPTGTLTARWVMLGGSVHHGNGISGPRAVISGPSFHVALVGEVGTSLRTRWLRRHGGAERSGARCNMFR